MIKEVPSLAINKFIFPPVRVLGQLSELRINFTSLFLDTNTLFEWSYIIILNCTLSFEHL